MPIDAVIIGGDMPEEVAKNDPFRLSINGVIASVDFLTCYFQAGKDFNQAFAMFKKNLAPRLPLASNGPYLWQFLQKYGFNTELIPLFSPYRQQLLDILKEKPSSVVISTTFINSVEIIDSIASFVKAHAPGVKVIAGGMKIWKSYKKKKLLETGKIDEETKDLVIRDNYLIDRHRPSPVDIFIASSRGEVTLAKLLACIKENADYTDLDNIAYFSDGSWASNDVKSETFLYDNGEVKVDWRAVPSQLTAGEVPVSSGMGCRFRCNFCDFFDLQECQKRSTESIIEEIRTIPITNDLRHIFFTEDNLFISTKQTGEFCKKLIEADLSLRWRSFVRVNCITDETAELLYKSGCRECLLGVESGDEKMLRNMNKHITPQRILEVVELLNTLGIHTQSTLIVGFPGETERTIQNTIDLLNAYPTNGPGMHFYYPFQFMVFPLSPIAYPENRVKYNLKGYMHDWSHSTMDSREAPGNIARLCASIKPELSPMYLENRIIPWMSPKNQKRVFYLRNEINRLQRIPHQNKDEGLVWRELEGLFMDSGCGNT